MRVNSQSQNPPSKQSKSKAKHQCSYCSGEHPAHECTKYKTVQSRKDRVLKLRLCFSCLTPGHSSKMCRSTKTCRSCGASHHSSLCIKTRANSSDSSNQSSNVSQGKTGNPLLVVVLTIVLKHKHSRTPLTNPLLHIINLVRVKLM